MSVCPCRNLEDLKIDYANCCAPYLDNKNKAPTSEALMRSRYTAYVTKKIDYIDETQITENGDEFDKNEALKWAESSEWLGLEIKNTKMGNPNDDTGIVEFIAHYKDKATGTELRHHETSSFKKMNGEWKFESGQIHGGMPIVRQAPKLGRNDPCHCGSGKKFKKCCGV